MAILIISIKGRAVAEHAVSPVNSQWTASMNSLISVEIKQMSAERPVAVNAEVLNSYADLTTSLTCRISCGRQISGMLHALDRAQRIGNSALCPRDHRTMITFKSAHSSETVYFFGRHFKWRDECWVSRDNLELGISNGSFIRWRTESSLFRQ